MKILSSIFFVFVTLLLSGCDDLKYAPVAVGQEGNVIVVLDSASWEGAVGEAIRQEIGRTIPTLPTPEPAFSIQSIPIRGQSSLKRIQAQKNIVFAASLDDSSRVAGLVRDLFSPEALDAVYTNLGATVVRDDLWRQRQKVAIIAAPSDDNLIELIRENGDDLRSAFNEITRVRSEIDMFKKGRQFDLEAKLFERHGFAVKVQHDYQIAIDTTDFVWLRRILSSQSWRSVFVHYIENGNPAELSPEWIYNVRDSLSERYVRGNLDGFVQIDRRRPLESENISFLGNFAYETRGLWQMVERSEGEIRQAGMGGPFVNYTFYHQDSGRIYMIDGMVFAPGFEKREFLRQVEVIAYSFRTTETENTQETETAALNAAGEEITTRVRPASGD